MELRNTIEDMLSSDYKKRFKAEYNQLKIRYPLNGCPSAVQLLEMIYNAVVRG